MNPNTPSVLVLGARGRFGAAVVRAFAAAGWQVAAQHRPGRMPTPAAAGNVRWLGVDVHDTAALAAAAGRADVVVHAMNPAYTDAAWRAEAPGLLRAAIGASRALGALLMFPGNVYNFGAQMPAVLREETPQRPTTFKGALRVALERELADAHAAHGLRSVVIRAGDFFGSGHGSLFDQVIAKPLHRGRMGLPAGLDTATPWAYLPDLARTFVEVAARRDWVHGAEVLHFRGHTLRGSDWRAALSPVARDAGWLRGAHDLLPVEALPWPLIRAVGLVHPVWASLVQVRYLWNTPHALDNGRLLALIGSEPHTPLATAARQASADLGLLQAPPALQPA